MSSTTEPETTRKLTIPNALSVMRLFGSCSLPFFAYFQLASACAWVLVIMWISDWLDGKLARLLHQRSELGARLDSIGDAFLYAAAVPSLWWLRPEFIRDWWTWMLAAGICYAVSVVLSFARFGVLPAYHTRLAKTCWLLAGVGLIVLFGGGPAWPALIAVTCGLLANLEAIAVSCVLREARTDVGSIYHVVQARKKAAA